MSNHVLWFLFVGLLLVSTTHLDSLLRRFGATTAQLQLLAGWIAGPSVVGLFSLEWQGDAKLLEVAAEIAVTVSLYAAGMKTRLPLSSRQWLPPVTLASLSMLATIVGLAAVGHFLLHLGWPAALLLGAVLAPTDPVLADEVQVDHADDDDPLRRTLTCEAGLNDGAAFPFVLLAVGLSDPALHALGDGLGRWIAVDVLWKIAGGLTIGWISSKLLGRIAVESRKSHGSPTGVDEIRSIGFIALVYGIALWIDTYAFLAVFATAVGLRNIELQAARGEDGDSDEHVESLMSEQSEVADVLERLVQVVLVVVVGVLFSTNPVTQWQAWAFAAAAIFVVRPAAVLATLHTRQLSRKQQRYAAWFGIRGIGTVYYLSHAVVLGVATSIGDQFPLVASSAVATITLSIVIHGVTVTQLCLPGHESAKRDDSSPS